jgi:hypothetical protein
VKLRARRQRECDAGERDEAKGPHPHDHDVHWRPICWAGAGIIVCLGAGDATFYCCTASRTPAQACGRSNRKVVPRPGVDCTSISPL